MMKGNCNICGAKDVEICLDFSGCMKCAEKYAKEQERQEENLKSFYEKMVYTHTENLCCYNAIYTKIQGLENLGTLMNIRELWDLLKEYIHYQIDYEKKVIEQYKNDLVNEQ